MILLDTNILTASKQSNHPDYSKVVARLQQFVTSNEELVICPQNLYEFFVASTRPITNRGLGFTQKQALTEIENLKQTYSFLTDPDTLYDEWTNIISAYEVSGKQGHDARIVAFMKGKGINKLYTNNVQDFSRYAGIITIV
ncbi:MAG: type II toxin-antitoxin system VapC family toxin [Agriterribacter sp.]